MAASEQPALQSAAAGSPGMAPDTVPIGYARGFVDALVVYETYFAVDEFANARAVQSAVIGRISDVLRKHGILIGAGITDVRIVQSREAAAEVHDDFAAQPLVLEMATVEAAAQFCKALRGRRANVRCVSALSAADIYDTIPA